MPLINFSRADLPLWSDGDGTVSVQVENPLAPLTPENSNLLNVAFTASTKPLQFGSTGTTRLGVSGSTSATLRALWAPDFDEHIVSRFGLAPKESDMLLALELGASAQASASGKVSYATLGAGATITAGVDGSYTMIRAIPNAQGAGQPAQLVLSSFFQGLRLPGDAIDLLGPGDVIALEYGGYLRVGASLTAGYQIKGSPKVQIGELNLSENYSFSALGSLSLTGEVAGRFSIEVRHAAAPSGATGRWARVLVRRSRSDSLGIAADVRVRVSNSLQGLPGSSDEFLGALLGVSTKSWFNYLTRVARVQSVDELVKIADPLARSFLSGLLNKGFDQIESSLNEVVAFAKKIESAYNNFDDRAIALLDKYFDKIDEKLKPALTAVAAMESWRELIRVPEDVRIVIGILTDSDPRFPLAAIANAGGSLDRADEGLATLHERAQGLIDALQNGLHLALLDVIENAKARFNLDALFKELEAVNTPQKLREAATSRAGGFANRLLGQALSSLQSDTQFKNAVKRIGRVLEARAKFQDTLFQRFTEAVNNDYGLNLRAEYQRSDEQNALIDALVNIDSPAGRNAALGFSDGEFDALLGDYDPAAIRINQGLLSRVRTRKRAFNVNVFGWHDDFNYERSGLDQLIVAADQHIKTEPDGTLNVYTQFSLSEEKVRRTGLRKSEEIIRTKLLLQAIGESRGVVEFDPESHRFLMDAVRVSGARYTISFNDSDTDPQELVGALRFAQELGILGATTPNQIARALPMEANSFGQVAADYDVRFTPEGLGALFSRDVRESELRAIMRKIVLINYLASRQQALTPIGWAYWTPGIYTLWKEGQAAFANQSSAREYSPIAAAPFLGGASPSRIRLSPVQHQSLSTLYFIEDAFVEAIDDLRDVLHPAQPGVKLRPDEFAQRLQSFGSALSKFDQFDEGVNTIFALFDQIIRLSVPAAESRSVSLSLSAKLGSSEINQIYGALPGGFE